MDITPKSKKPMSKDEMAYFVDLIQNYSILTSKETNAPTNKLKEDAWVSLTAAFNAKCGSIPKHKDQLKLKWDNLKKGACKRSQQIRMNNLKTGGGKADFIPPDEVLDKVVDILGATCTGFMVPFGGDGMGDGSTLLELEVVAEEEQLEVVAEEELQVHRDDDATVQLPDIDTTPKTSGGKRRKVDDGRLERNLAMANYYNKKADKLDLEIRLLK